ncbi:MAG: hypothetical protein HFI34_02710 [Lachnospiraceae bacterium]|nr:hypothetical protein [Lachnospiraceae bacterium]
MKMMYRLFRKKINNKGNTLGVVVIGILLLGILGTLILNITAANYQMKLADNSSKRNFYYVEKAVDEIYAGIGVEAMAAVSEAYQHVLSNVVSRNEENRFVTLNGEDAEAAFDRRYLEDLKNKYIENPETGGERSIEDKLSILKDYIGAVNKVTFNVEPVYDSDGVTCLTDVFCDETEQKIKFKDIKVSSRTASGFYVSVTTDFVVALPDINLKFADTGSDNSSELYKFALVVDGYETLQKKIDRDLVKEKDLPEITRNRLNDRSTPSFSITPSETNVNIIGNAYVGTNSVTKKDSVNINNSGLVVNVNAKNFICAGSVVIENAEANFNRLTQRNDVNLVEYGLLDSDSLASGMHLWANNLITDGYISNLNVNGDCIIADDLEINGDNSTVRINGNYFGYGYVPSLSNKNVEANGSDRTIFDESNLLLNDVTYDHEDRSAIMVNGKNADVILSPAKPNDMVILGGRAYIDLETSESAGNSTYMTGESVSFKGNQNLYKADIVDLGNDSVRIIQTNPVDYDFIKKYVNKDSDTLDYSALGIDESQIVAKRVKNSVYFYKYSNDPVWQTNYFIERMKSSFVRPTVEAQVKSLGVQNLKLEHENYNIYSVGAITEITNGVISDIRSENGVTNGVVDAGFLHLMEEMKYRYESISSELIEFNEAYGDLTKISEASKDSLYGHFVNEELLDEICKTVGNKRPESQNVQKSDKVPREIGEEFCQRVFGKGVDEINLGVTMMNNANEGDGGEVLDTEREYGVIIASGDVRIKHDFTGLILCGGNLTIDTGVTVTACPELVKFLATYDEYLSQLFGFSSGSGDSSEIKTSNTDYQKLITIENWRKN